MKLGELTLVRATANLPGLPRGQHALVDLRAPYMKGALRGKMIVRAKKAPPEWACVLCGADDERTGAGELVCAACA